MGSCLEENIWSKLSDDLAVEILCRVPKKPLIRSKCVSKTWHTLISHVCVPRISLASPLLGFLFRARNLLNEDRMLDYISYDGPLLSHKKNNNFFNNNVFYKNNNYKNNCKSNGEVGGGGFVESCTGLLPFKYSPNDLRDCCNGLLLFVRGSVPEFYVCNPTTKQCVGILEAPPAFNHSTDAVLAFNPCESLHYRVVRFVTSVVDISVSNPPRLDIFSSETGEWVTHTVPVEPPVAYGVGWSKRSIYLNGVLYKLSLSKHLLRFDLKNATVKAWAIELPEKERTDPHGSIGVSMGCFHYANHDTSRMLIWLLDDRCKTAEWILKHIIPFHELMAHPLGKNLHFYQKSPLFKPYAFHPTSGLIFIGIPGMVFSYNPTTKSLEKVFSLEFEWRIAAGQFSFFPYSPCPVVLTNSESCHCRSAFCT